MSPNVATAAGKFNVNAVLIESNNATHVKTLAAVRELPVKTYVMNVRKQTNEELEKDSEVKTDFPLYSFLNQDISVLLKNKRIFLILLAC